MYISFCFFPSNNKLRIIYFDLRTRIQKQYIKEQTTHKITIHLDLFLYVFFNIDRIVFWIFFYQALYLSSSDKFTLKRKLFLYTAHSSSIFDLKVVNGFFISYCSVWSGNRFGFKCKNLGNVPINIICEICLKQIWLGMKR